MNYFRKPFLVFIILSLILFTLAYCKLTQPQQEAELWREKGMQLFDEWKLDESISALQRSLSIESSNAATYLALGRTYQAMNRVQEAVTAWETATTINPKLEEAYYNLGLTHTMLLTPVFDLQKSNAAFETLLRLNPKRYIVYYYLAGNYLNLEQFEKAYDCCLRGLKLAPTYTKFSILQRKILERKMQVSESYQDLERAQQAAEALLALDSTDEQLINHVAYLYAERGVKLEEAQQLVINLIKRFSGSQIDNARLAYYEDTLGWINYKQGKFTEAINTFQLALKLHNPEDTDFAIILYYHLGESYYAAGKNELAREQYQTVMHLTANVTGRMADIREKANLRLNSLQSSIDTTTSVK